jgi:hypothetical protein
LQDHSLFLEDFPFAKPLPPESLLAIEHHPDNENPVEYEVEEEFNAEQRQPPPTSSPSSSMIDSGIGGSMIHVSPDSSIVRRVEHLFQLEPASDSDVDMAADAEPEATSTPVKKRKVEKEVKETPTKINVTTTTGFTKIAEDGPKRKRARREKPILNTSYSSSARLDDSFDERSSSSLNLDGGASASASEFGDDASVISSSAAIGMGFDVGQYERRVLAWFTGQPGQEICFREKVQGMSQVDISRLFAAILFLANKEMISIKNRNNIYEFYMMLKRS